MNRKSLLYLSFVLLVGGLTLWGCPKKAEVTAAPEAQTEKGAGTSTEAATNGTKPGGESEGSNEKSGAASEGLKPVYFDFNTSFIRDDAKAILKANAKWLKVHPKERVKIEGNCDERGTAEYNQALGQRRAASAKKYLTDMGIAGRRISLISYGKEKPICGDQSEDCWQKNRRDDFVAVNE